MATDPEATVVHSRGMFEEVEATQAVLFEELEVAVEIGSPAALYPRNLKAIAAPVAAVGPQIVVGEVRISPGWAPTSSPSWPSSGRTSDRSAEPQRHHPASAPRARELLI